jgi:hypothetical protein
MAVDPYGRNTKRGVLLNNRTLEMLEVAEMRWLRSFAPVVLTQGSYSTSVGASAGTHAGGGALDVRARDLTGSQRDSVVWALRRIGFAAWLRTPSQGDWPYHIHAVAIGDKKLSDAAKAQVTAYKNGRNGLANNGPDDGPRVAYDVYRQDIDLSYYGPEKWDEADFTRLARWLDDPLAKATWAEDVPNRNTDPVTQIPAETSLSYTHYHSTVGRAAAEASAKSAASADAKADQTLAKLDEVLGKLPPPA